MHNYKEGSNLFHDYSYLPMYFANPFCLCYYVTPAGHIEKSVLHMPPAMGYNVMWKLLFLTTVLVLLSHGKVRGQEGMNTSSIFSICMNS